MKKPANKTVWLTTAEIAQSFAVDVSTVRNWITRGVQAGGEVVRLQGLHVGRWLVRRKWLKEFLATLEAARVKEQEPPAAARPVESESKQQARFAEEKRRLQERLGRLRKPV